MKAVHESTGKALADELDVPRNFITRGIGLMGRRTLEPGRGMWIAPCNGIHMMFMRFPIDAVFLDYNDRIKKVFPNLPAWWGVVWFVWGANSVLELPPGSTAALNLKPGDVIDIR